MKCNTMTITNHVTNLELSRRLKELKVPQKTHFIWYENGDDTHLLDCPDGMRPMEQKTYSAYLASELGEMLPRYLVRNGFSLELEIIRSSVWRFYYGRTQDMLVFTAGTDDTEANARAKMLIYLIENHLISVNEDNK